MKSFNELMNQRNVTSVDFLEYEVQRLKHLSEQAKLNAEHIDPTINEYHKGEQIHYTNLAIVYHNHAIEMEGRINKLKLKINN